MASLVHVPDDAKATPELMGSAEKLKQMGFDPETSFIALKENKNNFDGALSTLMG